MERAHVFHFCLKWTIRTMIGLLALLVLLAVALLIIAQNLRGPLIRLLSVHTNRQIRVSGHFEAHLLAVHPHLTAEGVVIGNPPWTSPGVMAEVARIKIAYDLPFFSDSPGIHSLELEGATLHLLRDANGHANWQWREPGTGRGSEPLLVRSLRMPAAHVTLDDRRRHLKFDGTVTAADVPGPGHIHPLRIQGSGELNGRPANLTINADPMATVRHDQPFHFAFTEDSSGSLLTGRGSLPRPFDFHYLETTFDSAGEDMKDLYFLTGVHLPDTGAYRLSGKLTREDSHFEFSDLRASSGASDMTGTVSIETHHGHPRLDADLRSERLRVSDL
jgi:uncharacterized protein involved in outer membrane biogenesis